MPECPKGVNPTIFANMTPEQQEIIRVLTITAAQVEEMFLFFSQLAPLANTMFANGNPAAVLSQLR